MSTCATSAQHWRDAISRPDGTRKNPCRTNRQGRVSSAGGALGQYVVADLADDDLSAVEREVVELLVEALAVGMRPESADRLPELLLTVLGHRENAMRRAGVRGFGRHDTVLSIVSPPQRRPRCPFQGRGGKAGLVGFERK
jgi:hypothetical protein